MTHRKIRIVGVPLDLGQNRRGVGMGPSAIRAAGLLRRLRGLGHTVEDDGDIAVGIPEKRPIGSQRARYATEIAKVCERAARRIEKLAEEGWTPLALGGDNADTWVELRRRFFDFVVQYYRGLQSKRSYYDFLLGSRNS